MRIALGGLIVLSCLSCANAQQSAPQPFTRPDYSDNRSSAVDVIKSYYNAINLSQYARAYSYKLRGTPELDANALCGGLREISRWICRYRACLVEVGLRDVGHRNDPNHYAVPVVIRTSRFRTRQANRLVDVVRV